MSASTAAYLTAAFYKFVELADFAALKLPLFERCQKAQIKGTILLAEEGINGTIAGEPDRVRALLAWLRSDARLADLVHKEAYADKPPFYRMKVRLKREIVTLGVPGVNPALMVGTYVKPADWDHLLEDPDLVVIDVRNDYEVTIGSFTGALDPKTRSFSEFPHWVQNEPRLQGKPKVAMFCTGGIRCEKSTSYLRDQGFPEVYHLEGGILKYLETVPAQDSRWTGECFVFDERVAVGHGLVPGHHEFCRACRHPVSPSDKSSAYYQAGVSCPNCHGKRSQAQLQSATERQKQVSLAQERHQTHIGAHFERSTDQPHHVRLSGDGRK